MCSEPGNIACTTLRPSGVSATHGSAAWMSKKTAPLRRTAFSTSDNASIETSADGGARAPDARSFAWGVRVITLLSHAHDVGRSYKDPRHDEYRSHRPLLLRRGAVRSDRPARCHGLLPLRVLPYVVRGPGECLQPVEPGEPAHHARRPEHRRFREEPDEQPPVVHEVRRAPVHGPSTVEARGHLRGVAAAAQVRAGRARAL